MNARALAEETIRNLDPNLVASIGANPKAGASKLGLTVEALDAVPSRGTGGWCDGASFVDENRIMYRPTPGLRENFTICHELGHHLLRHNGEAMDWVYDHKAPDTALEDLCDKFAAALLVPADLVAEATAAHGFTAQAVVTLFEQTSASRLCCANAFVDQLPSKGFVAIVDPETGQIWGTAKKAETSPVSFRGQPVPGSHALHRLADTGHVRTKSWWPLGPNDRWDYYLDAIRHGAWDIAVFIERDLWDVDTFHSGQRDRQQYDGDVTCPCGYSGDTPWYPCNECKTPWCKKCRKCKCDWRKEREAHAMCQGCTQTMRAHLLVDGLCEVCR